RDPMRARRDRRRSDDLELGAGALELRLEGRGLFLRDAFLDRLGSALDQVLRLFQAETGDRAHFLDDLDLLVAGALEDDVERGLLLGCSSAAATTARGGHGDGSSRADSPVILEIL